MDTVDKGSTTRQAVEIAINLGLIFLLVAWCVLILLPFLSFIVWGAVIATAAYSPFQRLESAVGGRRTLAVVLFALIGLALVIGPTWLFSGSIIDSAKNFGHGADVGAFHIPPPGPNVQDWPFIGEKLYANWSQAASNLELWLEEHHEQLRSLGKIALAKGAGAGLSILQFILSILIAAGFLAHAEKSGRAMQRLFTRLFRDRGNDLIKLSTATIRSVAVGVLGIAFIQAVLGGIGMAVVGVPGAGVLALIILVLAIAQLPPWIVLLPVIFYVFSVESTTVAVIFAVWSMAVSFADAVLKPILLGRGVEAPMLVILLGAIGGMITQGLVGLFLGAVVLALGYTLFQVWLADGDPSPAPALDNTASGK